MPEKRTPPAFRVSLHGRVDRSFLALLGVSSAVAFTALVIACASGGSSGGASSDGGDDSTADGAVGEGGGGEGGTSDGGGTPVSKACADNASEYCSKLSTCSAFLLNTGYGDMPTCVLRLGGAYCNDIVTAPGSGWTGDGLEACVAARQALSCTAFLYQKPAPAACRPTGTISSGSCLWDSQCGAGYCRIPSGMLCGDCVERGNTGAACATSNDCDGNLVCSGGACIAPQSLGLPCSATMPCEIGMQCLSGKCIQPGGIGASCDADAGGVDCDYNLGAYCDGTMCAAVTVAMSASICGGAPPAACYADGVCQSGFCVPPIADGQPCGGDAGLTCTIPSVCPSSGVCSTPNAAHDAGQCP
jgi:hypothetical protein